MFLSSVVGLYGDEFTLEVPIGITVQCISMGTFNLITTLIHFHCQKRNKGPLYFALEVPMQFRLLDARPSTRTYYHFLF